MGYSSDGSGSCLWGKTSFQILSLNSANFVLD
uniref:Uncharacterized protein n=1 Tax=Rhizophora mucronata TaxID=61149 RepID=A0A2P2NFL4_RHIMU